MWGSCQSPADTWQVWETHSVLGAAASGGASLQHDLAHPDQRGLQTQGRDAAEKWQEACCVTCPQRSPVVPGAQQGLWCYYGTLGGTPGGHLR